MILFWIKESFRSIGRAKFSFLLSLISLTIASLLIFFSVVIYSSSDYLKKRLGENLTISVFISDDFSDEKIKNLIDQISLEPPVKSVKLITKEEAAKIFIEETGEDFRRILDYNPLPASLIVTLKSDDLSGDPVPVLISGIEKMEGVEEVVYRYEFAEKILHYIEQSKKYVFILTGIIILISIYLVFSTVKLILNAKRTEFETMKLVGAKISTIKIPIILNGILTGFIAGIIAAALVLAVYSFLSEYISSFDFLFINKNLYLMITILAGPLLGFFVSLISLRNVSLKI